MRVKQSLGERGSLKWVQAFVNRYPAILEREVRNAAGIAPDATFDWRSPLVDDEHAEYRDSAFLERLGLTRLAPELSEFWPTRGPQWDALGLTSDNKVILLEGKAHSSEMRSTCTASESSRKIIERSLETAKRHFGAKIEEDWTKGYYQYANRLAHLYFLREIGRIDAHLVFLYFTNDRAMRGPDSPKGWEVAIGRVHKRLGLENNWRHRAVHDVFLDARHVTPTKVGIA